MFENIGQILGQNPELTATVLDAIGRGVDPKNPMAGIGTSLAQSSLANKNRIASNKQQKDLIANIIQQLGGHTPKNIPGVTSYKAARNNDGVMEHQLFFNTDEENKIINEVQNGSGGQTSPF